MCEKNSGKLNYFHELETNTQNLKSLFRHSITIEINGKSEPKNCSIPKYIEGKQAEHRWQSKTGVM